MASCIGRRKFLAALGGAAVAWPLAARAQQPERMRRIGVLMSARPDDPYQTTYLSAFMQGLQERGWTIGRNVRVDYRWGAGDADLFRQYAAELVALAPDVILATAGSIVGALQKESRTVPIVFVTAIDPVGGGWVESLARPGTNATGFAAYEFSIGGKWLGLLMEVAPGVKRVAVIRDPSVPAGSGGFAAIQTAATSLRVELTPIGIRDATEIERGIMAFVTGTGPDGGLIMVGPGSSVRPHRDLIIALAARHRLPAVYPTHDFAAAGGLISYGTDFIAQYRQATEYVDRILKGEKPADLPVQAPTKYELVLNLKTARTLGLDVPSTLLATADEPLSKTCRRVLRRLGFQSKSFAPARLARSTRPSQTSCKSPAVHCWSVPIRFLPAGVRKSSRWRRATCYPRPITRVNSPRSAG
jgi:putative ABC transport system substrate-binding protein